MTLASVAWFVRFSLPPGDWDQDTGKLGHLDNGTMFVHFIRPPPLFVHFVHPPCSWVSFVPPRLLEHWDTRMRGHQVAGAQGCWDTRTLGHQDTETLEHWDTRSPVQLDTGTLGQRDNGLGFPPTTTVLWFSRLSSFLRPNVSFKTNCKLHYSCASWKFYKGLQVSVSKSRVVNIKCQMKCLKHVLTIHLSTNLNNV